ncbi:MAG: undecaprenyl/decaprenyl-phosphate alpha-N-acetylglucosaminyl 1-phosphate transferase [Clostridia bacterium]|nr:undecaprenyl/decaprenyl-phosphate alpha-N-acetylglucosaminyl 1-phosphate transferase [Clostridia bacterium]
MENIIYIIILGISFIVSYLMVPISIKIANKLGIIDNPKADDRRVHKQPIPRAGGIAIVTSMMFTLLVYFIITLFNGEIIDNRYIGYVLGAILIIGMGFVDDLKSLKPLYKFLFQLIAGMIIYVFGISIAGIKIPFIYPEMIDFGIWSFPVTLIWVLGITNAVNLIDGLDGLAAGISAIASISLLMIFAINGATTEAVIIAISLVGATVGFLPYNFNPAKTFMGDTGSNFLGYTLATISIMGMAKGYTVLAIVAPLIVVGVPVFDMLFAIVRRLAKHQKITTPDKGHIHHRLLKHGFSQKQAVIILYTITSILGVIAVTLVSGKVKQGIICAIIIALIWCIGYIVTNARHRKHSMISNTTISENENKKEE